LECIAIGCIESTILYLVGIAIGLALITLSLLKLDAFYAISDL
jgi:hypothetical protein